jgi:hypothetical protein
MRVLTVEVTLGRVLLSDPPLDQAVESPGGTLISAKFGPGNVEGIRPCFQLCSSSSVLEVDGNGTSIVPERNMRSRGQLCVIHLCLLSELVSYVFSMQESNEGNMGKLPYWGKKSELVSSANAPLNWWSYFV